MSEAYARVRRRAGSPDARRERWLLEVNVLRRPAAIWRGTWVTIGRRRCADNWRPGCPRAIVPVGLLRRPPGGHPTAWIDGAPAGGDPRGGGESDARRRRSPRS